MFQTIHWEINEGLATLTLQQPPSNRMDRLFFAELEHLVTQVIPAASFNAVIVCGQGRHFSSGADIDDLLSGVRDAAGMGNEESEEVPVFLQENNKNFLFFHDLEVPVIAAIQGVCLGSALELAMFCHFRICAEGALLALPEVSFNLMPGCGGTQTLVHLAGRSTALQLMLEGRNLNAEEARAAGVVDIVVSRKALMATAEQIAHALTNDYHKDKRDYYLRRTFPSYEEPRS
jgi:enoyl-CoA hydratase/carnithine racemase